MSKLVAYAYHPMNNEKVEVYEGFAWWCLLFGALWYAYKEMWGWVFISLILSIVTGGLAWLVFPFIANEQYAKHLRANGYLDESQVKAKKEGRTATPKGDANISSVADELRKLAALRDEGILTEEEFSSKKQQLLS